MSSKRGPRKVSLGGTRSLTHPRGEWDQGPGFAGKFRRLGRSWVDQLRQEFLWVRNVPRTEVQVSCTGTFYPSQNGPGVAPAGLGVASRGPSESLRILCAEHLCNPILYFILLNNLFSKMK